MSVERSRIAPFLWFDGRALEAARFYTAIFPNSWIETDSSIPAAGADIPVDAIAMVTFVLDGRRFMALDGGPAYRFTPAISFFVTCETQAEVDAYWEQLGDGGEHSRCGWLHDRFGVSWQIVPAVLGDLLGDPDEGRSQRALTAMLGMSKLDIAELRRAADG